jgi:hypothetical protein
MKPSTIRLVCDEPGIRTALRSWLDQGALDPPAQVSFYVRIGDPDTEYPGDRTPFYQPGMAVRDGPRGVRVRWQNAPALAELDPRTVTARVTLSPAAAARIAECARTFFLTVLILLLRRAGWHHVHAATAIDPSGQGWLIAGNAEAGKSTTVALLATCGWQVSTDDIAFLAPDRRRVAVVACRTPIALRPRAYRLLNQAGGVLLPEQRKVGLWPEDLGGRWVPRVNPDVIVFPSVGPSGETSAEPIDAEETLNELVRWSAWVIVEADLARQHLDLLTRLAHQGRGYRVTLGRDLFSHPDRLAQVVAESRVAHGAAEAAARPVR